MSLPTPIPGLVIGYSYLWSGEAKAGREEGLKDRPCTIVLVARSVDGRTRVRVLPITHRMPASPSGGVEIPPLLKTALGLDGSRSWVVLTESNEFTWPGPDLRKVPSQGGRGVLMGALPPRFFQHLRNRFLELARADRVSGVVRTE